MSDMRTIRPIYDVGVARVSSTHKLPVRGDPAVGYVVATVAITLRCSPYADCSFRTNSIACCSILVSSQRMGWSSVQAIADLSVNPLMLLLQTCFEPSSSLVDVHLSAGVRHFVDNVWLLLHREGSLTLVT